MTTTISGDTGIDKVQDGSIGQEDLGPNVVGNGPCFRAYPSTNTTVTATGTKITLGNVEFNTGGFDTVNSRFMPNVAGYYYVAGRVGYGTSAYSQYSSIRRNGVEYAYGQPAIADGSVVCDLIYLNGTTDYVELAGFISTSQVCRIESSITYLAGCLVRAA